MFHFDYVGHFDPADPVDTSVKPLRPKILRPLAHDRVRRLLDDFGGEVARYIEYDDGGYVVCSWSHAPARLSEQIRNFARALAETEVAMVMSEPPLCVIEYPEAARRELVDL
jgi:hypothetical protein